MNAILRTRCGCERPIQVPEPPPRDFRVAMRLPFSFSVNDIDALSVPLNTPIRVFELDDVMHSRRKGPKFDIAVYMERL